ncbi:uncharacterized protein LOC134838180 [Culicoides brevitarsis]|uniref:uncharacterized protein LOC134838180 n=1 Tax=Culicoides brevitarsis TaxID=469753 RepID=UPI00307CA27E
MENQIKFTEKVIIPKILAKNPDLKNLKLVKCQVDQNKQIDGFMGNIIFVNVEFENNIKRQFVVKLMKPPSEMRTKMDSDFMFKNELFIYSDVIPTFLAKFQRKFKTIDPQLWSPRVFLAESGIYPELSPVTETLLAMENLTPLGYRLGNRSTLSESELRLMCKAIAQYHACSYALRINKDPTLDELKSHLTPVPFTKEDQETPTMPDVTYKVAVDRLLMYLDENPNELNSNSFKKDIENFKKLYGEKPSALMQSFLRDDEKYSVILHGDYNRNNVLFKYEGDQVTDLRFIDFQEVRYGTPAIDVSFFLFMNMEVEAMEKGLLMTLVKFYHEHLMKSLAELLEVDEDDEKLKDYRWEPFFHHFKQFGLYGAMVAVLFIPWMICSEEECEKLTAAWEKDVYSEDYRQICLICGGDPVNDRITRIIRHASDIGFMKIFEKCDE